MDKEDGGAELESEYFLETEEVETKTPGELGGVPVVETDDMAILGVGLVRLIPSGVEDRGCRHQTYS